MNVPDEEDPGRSVHGRDVESGGFYVSAEIRSFERKGERSDASEGNIEEESCEDGEGGHGANRKAG